MVARITVLGAVQSRVGYFESDEYYGDGAGFRRPAHRTEAASASHCSAAGSARLPGTRCRPRRCVDETHGMAQTLVESIAPARRPARTFAPGD